MQHRAAIALLTCAALAVCASPGCVTAPFRLQSPDDSPQWQIVRDQLVFHGDDRPPPHHPLVEELVAERGDVATTLNLPPSDEPIHVHLFREEGRYREYVGRHYPAFPDRRAFFVENEAKLSVYAYWGERVAEDLRHEVAHGYLHASLPNLPIWLDEGLAEYFEVPRSEHGLNRPHVELLLAHFRSDRWAPNLARLERLSYAAEMSQIDYAESWAWVHWLLGTTPDRRELLRSHLAQMRRGQPPGRLSLAVGQFDESPQAALLHHLEKLSDRE